MAGAAPPVAPLTLTLARYMPRHKQIAIARETLEIFTPLAHRLGLWQYKTELADLSFKHLFPQELPPPSARGLRPLARALRALAPRLTRLHPVCPRPAGV